MKNFLSRFTLSIGISTISLPTISEEYVDDDSVFETLVGYTETLRPRVLEEAILICGLNATAKEINLAYFQTIDRNRFTAFIAVGLLDVPKYVKEIAPKQLGKDLCLYLNPDLYSE